MNKEGKSERLSVIVPWVRIMIMVISIGVILLLSYINTGKIIPENPSEAVIYQNALLLIILGSALLEYKFTKPVDATINSLMSTITLLIIYGKTSQVWWWVVSSYCIFVFIMSTTCIVLSIGEDIGPRRMKAANITFQLSTFLGKARLLISIVFLFALFSFYSLTSRSLLNLLLFWGIFVVIWPLKIPHFLSSLRSPKLRTLSIGTLVRVDHPNLVRAHVSPTELWRPSNIKILIQADISQRYIVPIYSQMQSELVLGTGILSDKCNEALSRPIPGMLYNSIKYSNASSEEIANLLGASEKSKLIGFVIEGSEIEYIRFEIWDINACSEGKLVWCRVGSNKVYYQVIAGSDHDEPLGNERHGYQVATAAQLGTVRNKLWFDKFTWLPTMNTPVFTEVETFGADFFQKKKGDYCYGCIPNTKINVYGPFIDTMIYHTAILGVTGSGKTLLAHEFIKHALDNDIKVICIDLTAKYMSKLSDLKPDMLSLDKTLVADLGQKLFDVDSGEYRASAEKKVLKDYADKLRENVNRLITQFITDKKQNKKLGIITLDEISNTKTTLYITEMYLSTLFHYAKNNQDSFPRTLVIVEEAHTVMPETGTMGIADYDSRGLVAKIAQIALQGRKYKIGLLVIAQRTATVSKSVLTQCNKIISFSCCDDTSLGFLSNVFGAQHTKLIPNLPFLQAVVYGNGIRSQRPLVLQIPYDPDKDEDGVLSDIGK